MLVCGFHQEMTPNFIFIWNRSPQYADYKKKRNVLAFGHHFYNIFRKKISLRIFEFFDFFMNIVTNGRQWALGMPSSSTPNSSSKAGLYVRHSKVVGPSNHNDRNFQILSRKIGIFFLKHIKSFIQILVFSISNEKKVVLNGLLKRTSHI